MPSGLKRDVVDRPVVAAQRPQRGAGPGVPELDRLVVAAGRQGVAVGRELGVVENVLVALEPARHDRPVLDLPDRRHAPQARDTRRRHQQRAVAAEMHGRDLAGEVVEHAERRLFRTARPAVRCRATEASRAMASHRPSREASSAVTGRTFACDSIRGTTRASRSAGRPPRAFGSGVDPRLQQRDLLGWARLALRGHRRLRQTRELADHPAGRRVAGAEHRTTLRPFEKRRVALERELPLTLLVVVAAAAILDEDRRNLRRVVGSGCVVSPHGRCQGEEDPSASVSVMNRIMKVLAGTS